MEEDEEDWSLARDGAHGGVSRWKQQHFIMNTIHDLLRQKGHQVAGKTTS